jgi:hypothetical protein
MGGNVTGVERSEKSGAENRVYNAAMTTITAKEKEAMLELNNEWAEVALRKLIFRLLKHRFTRVPATLKRRIGRLTEFTLEDLAEALLDFKNISDAEAWVAARNRA